MATTTNIAITLVEQAQAQKEVTVNAALQRIDALLNTGVIDKDLATPPGSPADNDLYIVPASPTGSWSGQAGKLAWYSQGWKFFTPREGLRLWVKDEDVIYGYTGSKWSAVSEVKQTIAAAATTVIDLTDGKVIELTQNTNITTFTWNNDLPSGSVTRFTLVRVKDNSGTTRSITWPAAVKWPAGAAPTLTQTANAVDVLQFVTYNAGTTWYGNVVGLAMA